MKRIVTPVFLLCIVLFVYAKDIVFGYDAAGNRTSAAIVLSPQTRGSNGELPKPVEQSFGSHRLSVYPNPTKGSLYIRMELQGDLSSNSSKQRILEARLFSLRGELLLYERSASTTVTLSLDAYASGSYLLVVNYGEERTDMKVIKE